MAHNITLIPGDGTGPEIVEATRRVVDSLGLGISWEVHDAGLPVIEKYGTPLPDHVLDSIRKNKVCLKGPITTPIGTGMRSVNVALRHALSLYACVRPCKTYPGIRSPFQNVDLVIVRENMEDLYAGIEFEKGSSQALDLIKFIKDQGAGNIREDSGISIKPISVYNTDRIVRYAFDYARRFGRKKVTAVSKANIMKFSDGLFLEVARNVAKDYSDVAYDEVLVDALGMQLVRNASQYDVLVLPNLYGDIMSDLCAGLVGGLGVAPGANIGEGVAVFEAVHGSAPRYEGQNKVNPMAVMFSAVLMLRYINEISAADRLEKAMADVIVEDKSVTYDMKPHRDDPSAVGTSQVADAIIEKLQVKV
jgi:isocitrate dehydrogenase (NAD+)